MRDEFSRRTVLTWASGALAFTALPKLPAVASIVSMPVRPSPMLGEMAIPIEDLTAAVDKVLNTTTYAEMNRVFREALWDAMVARAQPSVDSSDGLGTGN